MAVCSSETPPEAQRGIVDSGASPITCTPCERGWIGEEASGGSADASKEVGEKVGRVKNGGL